MGKKKAVGDKERIVQFLPAYDKRNIDPNKNYGIHGVTLRMILKGNEGAVQFLLFTNWQLPHVQEEMDGRIPSHDFPYLHHKPLPADLGYHSSRPMYEGQTKMNGKCDVLGGECYYDGSGVAAERIFHVLCAEGDAGVWRELGKYYNEIFHFRKAT